MKRIAHLGALGALLISVGCGGGSGPTGPQFPDVRGTWAGTWSLEARVVETGDVFTAASPGSVSITSQSGVSFSGSFLIRSTNTCDDESGTVQETVRQDGGITLGIDVPGGDPNAFEDLTGCVILSGDGAFTGIVSGNAISFDASFTNDCPTEVGIARVGHPTEESSGLGHRLSSRGLERRTSFSITPSTKRK